MAIYCHYSFLSLSFQHAMLMHRSPLHWSLCTFFHSFHSFAIFIHHEHFFFERPISLLSLLVWLIIFNAECSSNIYYAMYVLLYDDEMYVKINVCHSLLKIITNYYNWMPLLVCIQKHLAVKRKNILNKNSTKKIN